MEKLSYNLTGLTQVFNESAGQILSTELTVGGLCHNQLSPLDLGFTSVWAIFFFTKPLMNNTKTLKMYHDMTQIAKERHARSRRQDMQEQDSVLPIDNNESPCRMYTQWLSQCNIVIMSLLLHVQLSDLDLDFEEIILKPDGFNINYCSGICSFPQPQIQTIT